MRKDLSVYKKYRELIDYIFFGVLTTLVNILVFYILNTWFEWSYLIANALAIVLSIIFAYVTNKLFVFQSHGLGIWENVLEFLRFIGFRLLSGLADMLAMWLLVDFLLIGVNSAKLATQVLVVGLNYVFSKLFVFL